MPLDVFAPAIAASDQNVAANAARDLPAEFSEAFDVSSRSLSEWNSGVAYNNARDRALAGYYDDVRQKTGVQLPLYGMGGNVSLDELNTAIAKLPQQPNEPEPTYTPLSEGTIDGMTLQRMKKAHDDAAAFSNRETTWGGTAGTIAGTILGGLSDPVTIATLPLGGAGELGIGLRALEFAAISGGTEAVNVGMSAREREAAVPGSSKEIPGEIAGATLSGAVLGGAFGLLGKVLGYGAKALPTSVRDEVNAAASEFQFHATNPFPTAAGETAARDATVDATTAVAKGETVTSGNDFDIRHVADYALAAKAKTPEELALAGEQHLRPETFAETPSVERFDRMPSETDDAASYWEKKLEAASPEERAALGATDAPAETIAAAAIKSKAGEVFTGINHGDAATALWKAGHELDPSAPGDGFVTSTGRFVNRDEALDVAAAAKQLHDPELNHANRPDAWLHARDLKPAETQPDIAPRDMTPEQVAKLAADPKTEQAVLRNLDRIRVENPDAEFTTQVRQPDGSYQLVTRKLEDVLDEIDSQEALAKELEACATGMMAAE